MLTYINTQKDLEYVISIFNKQTYKHKKLYAVVCKAITINLEIKDIYYIDKESITNQNIKDFIKEPWVASINENDYYGENYLLDLVLSLKYIDAKIVGKATFYNQNKTIQISTKNKQYRYVKKLHYRSSIIHTSLISSISLSDFITRFKKGAIASNSALSKLSSLFVQTDTTIEAMFSTDEFNYCENGAKNIQEVEKVVNDLKTIKHGTTLKTILQEAERLKINPPKISLIVYIYKDEKQLFECIDSIQKQTLRELEIILVQNTTNKQTQNTIEKLSINDLRIKQILLDKDHNKANSLNKALQIANGEYIYFVESHNFLNNTKLLELTYKEAINHNAEILKTNKSFNQRDNIDEDTITIDKNFNDDKFDSTIETTNIIKTPQFLYSTYFCLFLYKKEFILKNSIKFYPSDYGERYFALKSLLKAKKITSLPIDGLVYRIYDGFKEDRIDKLEEITNIFSSFKLFIELFEELHTSEENNNYTYHLNFIVSQYIATFFRIYYEINISKNINPDKILFDQININLKRLNFTHEDLINNPANIDENKFNNGEYHLFITLILSKEYKLLKTLLENNFKIQQQEYYKYILDSKPSTALINRYIINHHISTDTKIKLKKNIKLPKIIIHIGSPHTKQNLIQELLQQNRPLLLKHGIWYPEVGILKTPKSQNHALFLKSAISNNKDLANYIKNTLTIFKSKINTIIISSETFFINQKAPLLAKYFKGYDISMVVYLKPQDQWLNSQYCEYITDTKDNLGGEKIKNWINNEKINKTINYKNTLQEWEKEISIENMIVRVYEKNLNIIDDFSNITNLKILKELKTTKNKMNLDINTKQVQLMRLFNKLPFNSKKEYSNFATKFLELTNEDNPSKVNLLSYELRKKILDRYEKDNNEIANLYLKKNKLFDDTEIPKVLSSSKEITIDELDKLTTTYLLDSGINNTQKIQDDDIKEVYDKQIKTLETKLKKLNENFLKTKELYLDEKSEDISVDDLELLNNIKLSKHFDKEYYFDFYDDVKTSKYLPLEHFIKIGLKENRQPNNTFDPLWYSEFYADIKNSKTSPFIHFISYGEKEGRVQNEKEYHDFNLILNSKMFDFNYYLKHNPELKNKNRAITHFLRDGYKDGKKPNKSFDPLWYLNSYKDVKDANINPFVHYILHGKGENRSQHI
jgi:glycosyltransferase involved in cell wall biosynthesis